MRPELLLREKLPLAFPDDWDDAYDHLFCDFFKTVEILEDDETREILQPFIDAIRENDTLIKEYGFDQAPRSEQIRAWATLLRVHVGHIFMHKMNPQTRLSLITQLYIDSHLQFVAFLRRYHMSEDSMEDEVDFYTTVPQYNRVMYQLPDLRLLLYKTDFFSFYPIPPNAPWKDILHIFLTKATFHKCKIRNHESMTAVACIRNPALLGVIKLVMAQALLGYLGGSYRPKFATRLWLSQWLQILAQMEIVQFRWMLTNRKKFMHMALREMSVYQVQHAPSIHAALKMCWDYEGYENDVHSAMDDVRRAFDEQPAEEWIESLPHDLLHSTETPTPAELRMSEIRVEQVRGRVSRIMDLMESHLEEKRRKMLNAKLRKGTFAECCATMLRKNMRNIDPMLMTDPRRRTGDPVLSDEDLRKVHLIAAHAARRGDNFLEIPLLDLLGVNTDVQQQLKNMYFAHEGFGESDNSLTDPLRVFMKTHPRDVAIVHRFCETVARCQKRVLTSLPADIMRAQLDAVRKQMNLRPTDPTPPNAGDFQFCWCNEPLSVAVTPETTKKRAVIMGAYRSRYNPFTDQVFCERNIIHECTQPPITINLVGRVLRIANTSYTICVDCGMLTTMDIDRWHRGPTCGRHHHGEALVFRTTGFHTKLLPLDGFKELAKTMRSEVPPPPNVAVTVQCEFCTEYTSRPMGRRQLYCFDDTQNPPDFRDIEICSRCFDIAKRRAFHDPNNMLYSEVRKVVVGWLTRTRDVKYIMWVRKRLAQGKTVDAEDAQFCVSSNMPGDFKLQ